MATGPEDRPTRSGWPARLVRLAVLLLPRGPVRERYRLELLADLAFVDHRGRFALQVVLRAPRLRRATFRPAAPSALEDLVTAKPFLCRTNLRHRWELAETSDGEEFVRCAKCLKERWTGLANDRSVAANVIANYGTMH